MSDYEIGYGKPPRDTQFKSNNCANPNGRRGRRKVSYAAITLEVENRSVEYRKQNQVKRANRKQLTVDSNISGAVQGNIGAAKMLLEMRLAKELNDLEPNIIVMTEVEYRAAL